MCWFFFAGCARTVPWPSPPHNAPRFDERNRAPLHGTATAGCHVYWSEKVAPHRFFRHVNKHRSVHMDLSVHFNSFFQSSECCAQVTDVTLVTDVRHSSFKVQWPGNQNKRTHQWILNTRINEWKKEKKTRQMANMAYLGNSNSTNRRNHLNTIRKLFKAFNYETVLR